jgi:microcystin degradation protein MlrC
MTRVAIGGISHETNTFSSIQTTLSLFQQRTLVRGRALIAGSRGVGSALGGMVDAASERGWELVPTLFASAMPGGRVRRGTFETLTNDLVDGIIAAQRTGPLNGVLLALHGAMVSEALADAEGEILRRVRRAIGPDVPIAAVFDSHANLTPAIVAYADVILAYETYPHVDTHARGAQAVTLLDRVLQGEIRPAHTLRQIPMLLSLPAQWTEGSPPMREVARLAALARQEPGVISVVLAGGFPYSDIPAAGMSVIVTTNDDLILAARVADEIAEACWNRREQFQADLMSLDGAVALAGNADDGPVVLADVADNPGGGASGDGTALLEALLDARIPDVAVAAIADPEEVGEAFALGMGERARFRLGGKIDRLHGPTLEVDALVKYVGNVSFMNHGPMGPGTVSRLGQTVVLAIGDPPVEVVVTERRTQVLGPEMFRAVGITPEERRVLVVKSSVHFRAAFEQLAARIIAVDGPGLSSPNLRAFPYRHVRRPIWPLDEHAEC